MFEEFYNDIMNRPPTLSEQYVNITDSPMFNPDMLVQQLANVPNMQIKDIYDILVSNYKIIIEDICENGNGYYIGLFLHENFLVAFTQAMNNIYTKKGQLDFEDIRYCNRIIYSFYTSQYSKNESISSLMMNLCKVINKKYLPDLLGKGFTDDLAAILTMNRFSHSNEMINIQRLNACIVQTQLTVQNIVDLYCSLFDKMITLFEGSMLYCNEPIANEQQGEMYSRISLALLLMLEDLPSSDIKVILNSYAGDYTMLYTGNRVRFSMNSLSADYPRINSVVAELRHSDGVFLP